MTVLRPWPLGVFASLDAGLGVSLEVAHALGVPTLQLHAPSPRLRTAECAAEFLTRIRHLNMTLTAVFGGFEGESYADIPTVARTVGLVPEATRSERLAEMKEISDFAGRLECNVVALHLGFVPHDRAAPLYGEVVATTQELCRHCERNLQSLHLETGQETAEALLRFIEDVGARNLFVNFDPANMILYGTGEPIAAPAPSAASCEASTARTRCGPTNQGRRGVARSPWARAPSTSAAICKRSAMWATTAR